MQNDFITEALGSAEAVSIVPGVLDLVKNFDGAVIFTRDTHNEDYLLTQEGKKLPVPHCIKGTHGWQICDALLPHAQNVVDKPTFGSAELISRISEMTDNVESVTLVGLCTDICVISNAMLVKAGFPEARVAIISDCCAGVTPASHKTALEAMKAVQIEIL